MYTLKDGSTTEDPRLDLIFQKDEKSRNYAAVDLLTTDQRRPRYRTYSVNKWLDQGTEGACVGAAFAHELCSTPLRVAKWKEITMEWAVESIYWEAQKIDPWPGGAYPGANPHYEGTSMLAGLKIVKQMGYIEEYRWAFGEQDLALAVSHLGPAVIGVNWYMDMYSPNKNFYITPTGRHVGGHAIVVNSINPKMGYYRLWNSWGQSWGRNGWCYISRGHMAELLAQSGEAVIPLVRREMRPA